MVVSLFAASANVSGPVMLCFFAQVGSYTMRFGQSPLDDETPFASPPCSQRLPGKCSGLSWLLLARHLLQ
jgi:hypothetical protein